MLTDINSTGSDRLSTDTIDHVPAPIDGSYFTSLSHFTFHLSSFIFHFTFHISFHILHFTSHFTSHFTFHFTFVCRTHRRNQSLPFCLRPFTETDRQIPWPYRRTNSAGSERLSAVAIDKGPGPTDGSDFISHFTFHISPFTFHILHFTFHIWLYISHFTFHISLHIHS